MPSLSHLSIILLIAGGLASSAFAMPEQITHPIQPNLPPPVLEETAPPTNQRPAKPKIASSWEDQYIRRQRLLEDYLQIPLSLVERDARHEVFSRDINRITAIATEGNKEWLGTRRGIKCVDRDKRLVTIYGVEEGLPEGTVTTICTSVSGVVAAQVQLRNTRTDPETGQKIPEVAICLFDSRRQRWQVLQRLPRSKSPSGEQQYSYYLALTDSQLLVFPSILQPRTESPYYAYPLPKGNIFPIIRWDEAFSADHPFFSVNAVFRRGDKLYLGTNVGLLELSETERQWRRTLPAQDIRAIAGTPDGPLWLLDTPRQEVPGQPLSLQRYDPTTKSTGDLLESTGEYINDRPPSLVITDDGTPWLITKDKFRRFDSVSGHWQQLDDTGKEIKSSTVSTDFIPYAPFYSVPPPPIAPSNILPDAPLQERIRLLFTQESFGAFPNAINIPMNYLRQRFGRWISPIGMSKPMGASRAIPVHTEYRPAQVFVEDPSNPTMSFGLENSNTLLSLPTTEVPAQARAPLLTINNMDVVLYKPIPSSARNVRRYTLYDKASNGEAITISPEALLSMPNSDDTLLAIINGGLFQITPSAQRWQPIETKLSGLTGGDQRLFRSGPGGITYLQSWQSNTLMRLDKSGKTLTDTNIQRGNYFRAGTSAGLWRAASHRTTLADGGYTEIATDAFEFAPYTVDGSPGGWRMVNPPLPPNLPDNASKTRGDALGFTGSIVWFRLQGGSTLIGYDALKERWTAPAPVPADTSTDLFFAEADKNTTLVGLPVNSHAAIYRYDSDKDTWQLVLPDASLPAIPDRSGLTTRVKPPESSSPLRPLVTPEGDIFAIDSSYLWYFDITRKQLEFYPLPEELDHQHGNQEPLRTLSVTATQKAVYAGSSNVGLWRFDRTTHKWSRLWQQINWSPDQKSLFPYALQKIVADSDGVWAIGAGTLNQQPVLLRWDRQKKHAHFLTWLQTGVALKHGDYPGIASSEGSTLLWCSGKPGLYRAKQGKTDFYQIDDTIVHDARSKPGDPHSIYLMTSTTLLCYDDRTDKIVPISIPSPTALQTIETTKEGVYIGTTQGAYYQDKHAKTWTQLPGTGAMMVQTIYRDGDTICVVGESDVVRYREK